jgi:hypothetical protein
MENSIVGSARCVGEQNDLAVVRDGARAPATYPELGNPRERGKTGRGGALPHGGASTASKRRRRAAGRRLRGDPRRGGEGLGFEGKRGGG